MCTCSFYVLSMGTIWYYSIVLKTYTRWNFIRVVIILHKRCWWCLWQISSLGLGEMVGWLDFFSSLEISSHSRGECDAIMDQKGQDGDFLVSFGNESNVTLSKQYKNQRFEIPSQRRGTSRSLWRLRGETNTSGFMWKQVWPLKANVIE